MSVIDGGRSLYELWLMVAGPLSESGIKHGSVVDAVVVVTEVCE